MPVLSVIAGRSMTGRRLAGLAPRRPPPAHQAGPVEQAGVIATANLGELLDTAVLLASSRRPRAQGRFGIEHPRPPRCSPPTLARTRACRSPAWPGTPTGAPGPAFPAAHGGRPGRYTLLVGPGLFGRCLELVGADPNVDAVLALMTTSAGSDPVPEVAAAPAARADRRRVLIRWKWSGCSGARAGTPRRSGLCLLESAAPPSAQAARYGMWRAVPPGNVPDLDGLRQDRARDLVANFWPKAGRR